MSLHAALVASRGVFTLDATIEARPGATLAVVGPNGAGKSTLISAIAGLIPLEAGRIEVAGRVLDDTDAHTHVPVERRRVGVVFQDYLLFPHLTVLENIAFGPRSARTPDGRRASAAASRDRAHEWLDRLELTALAHRHPAQISGGQQQRVALARALATEPAVLLLDEPLAALDVEVRDDVRAELREHLAQYSGSTVVVTHSIDDVRALGADAVVLEAGRVTQRGSVGRLLRHPATAYARRLVGA